jgi:hypothetical protein
MTRTSHQNRPIVTVPVDGYFGVADPHDSAVTTYWEVDRGELHPYPKGQGIRWAPSPPRIYAPTREERDAERNDWYTSIYWPWKIAVRDAIAADPAGAARAFRARYPVVERPPSAVRRARAAEEAQRRHFEAVWAASAARHGVPVAGIARRMGIAWSTARVRVAEGELLFATEPDRPRAVVAEYVQGLLEPDHAERTAAAILDGQLVDVTDLVAARLPDGLSVAPASQPADMLARLADRLHKEGSGT